VTVQLDDDLRKEKAAMSKSNLKAVVLGGRQTQRPKWHPRDPVTCCGLGDPYGTLQSGSERDVCNFRHLHDFSASHIHSWSEGIFSSATAAL
jgi:hypothetical protein